MRISNYSSYLFKSGIRTFFLFLSLLIFSSLFSFTIAATGSSGLIQLYNQSIDFKEKSMAFNFQIKNNSKVFLKKGQYSIVLFAYDAENKLNKKFIYFPKQNLLCGRKKNFTFDVSNKSMKNIYYVNPHLDLKKLYKYNNIKIKNSSKIISNIKQKKLNNSENITSDRVKNIFHTIIEKENYKKIASLIQDFKINEALFLNNNTSLTKKIVSYREDVKLLIQKYSNSPDEMLQDFKTLKKTLLNKNPKTSEKRKKIITKRKSQKTIFPEQITLKQIKIVKGNTLYSIAEKYLGSGLEYKKIAKINGIIAPYTIYPGQNILLTNNNEYSKYNHSTKKDYIVVKQGDSLYSIAEKYLGSGNLYYNVAHLNNLLPPYLIIPGQKLKIDTLISLKTSKYSPKALNIKNVKHRSLKHKNHFKSQKKIVLHNNLKRRNILKKLRENKFTEINSKVKSNDKNASVNSNNDGVFDIISKIDSLDLDEKFKKKMGLKSIEN